MSEQRKRKAAQPPISAHPAFPAIVALWFAALLGIGSLVLPIALFENMSEASGLASLVVAAQPPLGVTARILIALVAAGLGVAAGLAIARKVIVAGTPRPAPRRSLRDAVEAGESTAKRPISAHAEFGEGGLQGESDDTLRREPMPGRRRALSVTDDSARSEFLDHAPLPGFSHPAEPQPAADDAPEPLDLAAFDAEPESAGALADEPPARFDAWAEPDAAFGTASLSAKPVPGAAFVRAATPPADRAAATQPAEEVRMHDLEPAAPFSSAFAAPEANPAARPDAASEASPGTLAMADLVDRFARALEQHRAAGKAEPDAVVDMTGAFADKGKAAADEAPAPAAFAAPASPPIPSIPAALRPLGLDEIDDEDEDIAALGLSLGATRLVPAPADAVAVASGEPGEAPDEEPVESEESYSSLLAMKSPFGLPREPVRIEDEDDDREGAPVEPVVVFPGQAARRAAPAADGPARDALAFAAPAAAGPRPFDAPGTRLHAAAGGGAAITYSARIAGSGDTERALREALEKLQKMSGAA